MQIVLESVKDGRPMCTMVKRLDGGLEKVVNDEREHTASGKVSAEKVVVAVSLIASKLIGEPPGVGGTMYACRIVNHTWCSQKLGMENNQRYTILAPGY